MPTINQLVRKGRKKRLMKLAFAIFIPFITLVITLTIGFLTPYIMNLYDTPNITFIDNIGEAVAKQWQKFVGDTERNYIRPDTDLRFSSVFTPLTGKVVNIPFPERAGDGGAVTSWGDDILLLTHEGKIYVIDSDLNYTLTKIAPPKKGFEDYKAASTRPPYDAYRHNLAVFRYNDISAFRAGSRRGLVVSYTKFNADRACYHSVWMNLPF